MDHSNQPASRPLASVHKIHTYSTEEMASPMASLAPFHLGRGWRSRYTRHI